MTLTELHFHTSESSPCGKVHEKKGLTMYQKAGYGAVVVTDHFSRSVYGKKDYRDWAMVVNQFLAGYEEAKQTGQKLGVSVYLGMELRFPHDENDFLIYGLDKEYLLARPWIYEQELNQVYEDLQKHGMVIFQAHPFREKCSRANPSHLNGIEIINGNPRHNSRNDLASSWAREHNLVGICGSDFHQVEDLNGNGVSLNSLPESERELAQRLKIGEFTIHVKRKGEGT